MIGIPGQTPTRADASITRTLRRALRRNRWLIVITPLLTVAAALVFISVAVPIYDGTASLRIDEERSSLAVLEALQELSTGSKLPTEAYELRGRSIAENVVDELNLHAQLREPRRVTRSSLFARLDATRTAAPTTYTLERINEHSFRLTRDGRIQQVSVGEEVRLPGVAFVLSAAAAQHPVIELGVQKFELAVQSFRRTLDVSRPDREANILEIRYEAADPELAQAAPNEAARQFIKTRDTVRKTQARSTVEFLAEQNKIIADQLRTTEAGLLAFRDRQRVFAPVVEAETRVEQLATMQADRDILQAERSSLATIITEIEQNAKAGDSSPSRRLIGFPSLLVTNAATELWGSLTQLENERAELLRRYSEREPTVIAVTRRIRDVDNQLMELATTYLQGLTSKVALLDRVLANSQHELSLIPAKEIQLARLMREAKVREEVAVALETRLQEAQIAAAVEDPSVRVVDPAILPLSPIRPNRPFSLVLALLLGLGLGLGAAFGREHLDNTIRNRDELQEVSGTVPVLGTVPRIQVAGVRSGIFAGAGNGSSRIENSRLMGDRAAHGPVAEAYRILRTNIAFSRPDTPAKVLVITSALPSEGKSTSASNLAITLAQQNLRVVLVDADMRRGLMHQSLGIPREPGLSSVLLGRVTPAEALHPVSLDGASLYCMPTGPLPPSPAELLASPRLQHLLDQLKPEFDAIVLDTPPLNLVTDAAIIGSRADGVLLVVRARVTDRDAYRYALEQLQSVNARVLGCVLNDADTRAEGYYGRDGAGYYTPRAAT